MKCIAPIGLAAFTWLLMLPAWVIASPDVSTNDDTCDLGNGFDLGSGCKQDSPIDPSSILAGCSAEFGYTGDQACLVTDTTSESSYKTYDIRSANDHSSAVSSETTASGSGWGVHVSVSVGYMTTHDMSESSISFGISDTRKTAFSYIRNPQLMKLSGAAKALLRSDPAHFLATYGPHYVHSITYGGSFFGAITLYEKSTSETSSLDIMASFKADDIFGTSSDASSKFSSAYSEHSSQLTANGDIKSRGGSKEIDGSVTDPATLSTTYNSWGDSLSTSTDVVVKLQYGSWYDLDDVKTTISESGIDDSLFVSETVTDTAMQRLTSEYAQTKYVQTSIQHAQQWACANLDSNIASELSDMAKTVENHLLVIEQNNDEAFILLRQDEMANQDYSFFVADELLASFKTWRDTRLLAQCTYYCSDTSYWPTTSYTMTETTYSGSFSPTSEPASFDSVDCGSHAMRGLWTSSAIGRRRRRRRVHLEALDKKPEKIMIECADYSNNYGVPIKTTALTNWVATIKTDPNAVSDPSSIATYSSLKCPVGEVATALHTIFKGDDPNLAHRYWRMQCAAPDSDLGYVLDTTACRNTDWVVKDETSRYDTTPGEWNTASCSSLGSNYVVTRMDMTHKAGSCCFTNWEAIRFQCCPLVASFVYCPGETLIRSGRGLDTSASPASVAEAVATPTSSVANEDDDYDDIDDTGDAEEEEHWVGTEPGESCGDACGSWGAFEEWSTSTCTNVEPGHNELRTSANRYCSWDGSDSTAKTAHLLCLCKRQAMQTNLEACGCQRVQGGSRTTGILCKKLEADVVTCLPPNNGDGLCPGDHSMCWAGNGTSSASRLRGSA